MKVRAITDKILATNLEMGERITAGGIIVADDNMKTQGIRPRWCQVYSMGNRCIFKDEIEVDDWILVHHGRWTLGMKYQGMWIWQIDPDGLLLHSKTKPSAENMGGIGNPSLGPNIELMN